MRAGAPFKIALFADLHFGEATSTDWGPLQDVNSTRVMNTVLDDETPDFVIYLGDVITANNIPIANASLYWDQAISPTKSRGIPFASVFGNHDDAPFEWPKEWFPAPGIPPLICPAVNSTHSVNERCSHLVFGVVDTRPPQVISNAQAEWFQNKSEEINPNSSLVLPDSMPELIFWHIPSQAYNKVAPQFGIHKPCVGSINKENVSSQAAELGIMDLLVKRPSVKAIFVGHKHGLDWCCPYEKLWLCFARHTGYGGYGDWPRGARIIEITQQPFSFRTWIRMEDSIVHSNVVHGSTNQLSYKTFDQMIVTLLCYFICLIF
ncbi:probable inactive purple acid phosphatase 16 [Quercus lobata]|uniref:probable inactive purple acid phosphatase 16 n=1 Tax=Quercus lobata TaxID=97700 RepID=UPI001247716B|nr:probable inactive purple acid phosphatase 16 [Quercus lobata]